jgi:hypothetical protein
MHLHFHEIFLEHLSLPKNAEIEDVKKNKKNAASESISTHVATKIT